MTGGSGPRVIRDEDRATLTLALVGVIARAIGAARAASRARQVRRVKKALAGHGVRYVGQD